MGRICNSGDEEKVASLISTLKKGIWSDFSVALDKTPRFCITFTLRESGKDIAGFTLVEQVNCCGLLISTKTFVNIGYGKMGIAQEMMPLKEAIAKEFGYSSMMATVNMTGNPAEVHILEKFGWSCVNSFVNSRTKNTVGIFTKNL